MDKTVWIGELHTDALGTIWVALSPVGLTAVSLWDDRARFEQDVAALTGAAVVVDPARVAAATSQIAEYLVGERTVFELPIDWSAMTPFQQAVLRVVAAIPYGRKSTYGDVAAELGKPGAVRAVGRANATNPMPIVIPCHRVLGADGKLHGYSAPGGLETKAWLLRLEGSWLI